MHTMLSSYHAPIQHAAMPTCSTPHIEQQQHQGPSLLLAVLQSWREHVVLW